MRLRIKYTKTGCLKYLGHLDVMRYFQKVLRRSDLRVKFSEGFSPHMLMSFALPLSVGATTEGDYFDVDADTELSSEELLFNINRCTVPDMKALKVIAIPEEKSAKCMTQVAAADYILSASFDGADIPSADVLDFLNNEEIRIEKKSKKSVRELDIRPLIYKAEYISETKIKVRISSGSVDHLQPTLLYQAFVLQNGREGDLNVCVHRLDLLAKTDEGFTSLGEMGKEF